MNLWLKPAVAILLLTAPSLATAADYKIDPDHTHAQFTARHMMVTTVRGEFRNVSGTVQLDEKDVTKSKVEATIDATTVNTRVADRDTHLKSEDFLHVEKYPKITFKSKSIKAGGSGSLQVKGDLTIRGVTKEVVLNVEGLSADQKDPWGGIKRGATASTKINRKDFGLTWNKQLEAGGVLVSDEVAIVIDIQLDKVQPSGQATNK
jgi:polyisoprenoid-binding protein YceI